MIDRRGFISCLALGVLPAPLTAEAPQGGSSHGSASSGHVASSSTIDSNTAAGHSSVWFSSVEIAALMDGQLRRGNAQLCGALSMPALRRQVLT